MASSTPPSAPRRPFFIRWWYVPVQRRRVIIATVLALLYGSGLAYGSWTRVCAGDRCPSIMRIDPGQRPQLQTSKVYAADGRLITELGIERRTVVPLDQIPVHVRQAFLATEDKRFYRHHGIDFVRLPGAMLKGFRGFSTITQQLGPNVAGVEAASQVYFGKSVRDINVAEAATLAALPKAPGTYNPRTHPDNAIWRRNVVLTLMRNQGFLTPEDAEFWKAYPLVLTTRRTSYGDVAPYFVEWLRSAFLEPRFGRDLY